jgi:glycolate oxidase FAD binding subunit
LQQGLGELREEIERDGGSLVVLTQPTSANRVETWGTTGAPASLMRALKNQFDPKGTLNPGRFAGGI